MSPTAREAAKEAVVRKMQEALAIERLAGKCQFRPPTSGDRLRIFLGCSTPEACRGRSGLEKV